MMRIAHGLSRLAALLLLWSTNSLPILGLQAGIGAKILKLATATTVFSVRMPRIVMHYFVATIVIPSQKISTQGVVFYLRHLGS